MPVSAHTLTHSTTDIAVQCVPHGKTTRTPATANRSMHGDQSRIKRARPQNSCCCRTAYGPYCCKPPQSRLDEWLSMHCTGRCMADGIINLKPTNCCSALRLTRLVVQKHPPPLNTTHLNTNNTP